MSDLVVGSQDTLRYRFVDEQYDASTGLTTFVPIDLTAATEVKIVLRMPDGTTAEKTCTKDPDPTTGYVEYDLAVDDLQAGGVKVRGRFVDGLGRLRWSAGGDYIDVELP